MWKIYGLSMTSTSMAYLPPSIPSSGSKLFHAMGYGLAGIQRNTLSYEK